MYSTFLLNSSGSGAVPDWVTAQWEHTNSSKRKYENGGYGNDDKQPELVGACTAVGMNDRVYQIKAVHCENEVADIVCQPST